MGVSLNDILKVASKDELLDKFIALLRLAGFPTSAWDEGSFQRYTSETESSLLSDLTSVFQQLGKAGFIKLAAEVDDDWVDLCAEGFAEQRKPAVYTRGSIRLTDAEASGPHTIAPGAFWVANDDQSLRFVSTNTTPVIIPLGGYVDVTFQAESPGSAYNVGNGALREVLTPLPGVTAENRDAGDGTWITQQGTDRESSVVLAQRCIDKWSTLGSGSNEGAYRYWATSAANEITDAKVYSPGAGSVRVIVRGASGPVSASALAAAATLVEAKRPLGVPDVVTANCIARVQNVAGTLYITAGDLNAKLAAAQAAAAAYARSLKIGGRFSRERLIRALLVDDTYDDLDLATPPADFQLGINEVVVLSFSLSAAFA